MKAKDKGERETDGALFHKGASGTVGPLSLIVAICVSYLILNGCPGTGGQACHHGARGEGTFSEKEVAVT